MNVVNWWEVVENRLNFGYVDERIFCVGHFFEWFVEELEIKRKKIKLQRNFGLNDAKNRRLIIPQCHFGRILIKLFVVFVVGVDIRLTQFAMRNFRNLFLKNVRKLLRNFSWLLGSFWKCLEGFRKLLWNFRKLLWKFQKSFEKFQEIVRKSQKFFRKIQKVVGKFQEIFGKFQDILG